MTQSVVAGRYAHALFTLAVENGNVETVHEQLQEMKTAFQATPELYELLHTPTVTQEQKKELLASSLHGVDPSILHTLYLLIDNNRINEMLNLVDAFHSYANEASGVEDAVAYTTRELTDEEKAAISEKFARLVGKKTLNITNIVQPELIGGLRLQVGNLIYDSSVQARLERLKRQMLG